MGVVQRRREGKGAEGRSPDELATSLVEAICTAFEALKGEQNHLFLTLGYTMQNRLDLSVVLAQSLYRTGMEPLLSREDVHRYMTEGELQAILYQLVCGDTHERILRQALPRLLQRPDFRRMAVDYRRHVQKDQDDDEPTAPTQTEGTEAQVPQVLTGERRYRRGPTGLRTQRDTRRTRRCDYRPVSEC